MSICRPCTPLIAVCPDDFSGGFVPTPVPSQQRVCNTEQTASCPDSSDPQVIPAGTFCITVLNPTTASLAQAQTDTNNMALAQAESQVGDCAWTGLVWTTSLINIQPPHNGAVLDATGLYGDFFCESNCPPLAGNGGTIGINLQGDIDFTYGLNTTKHHNLHAEFINTSVASGLGAYGMHIEIYSGANFGALALLDSHIISGLVPANYTYDYNFTTLYTGAPLVFRIVANTTAYFDANATHTQSITGLVKALD